MTQFPPESPDSLPVEKTSAIALLYRYRFWLSALALVTSLLLFSRGISTITDFSRRIDSMSEQKAENPEPKLFDTRTDIWFDPGDEGLVAYRDVEDRFIAEDIVIVAFEEKDDPWGVFGKEPLQTIQKLTNKLEKVPYVRNVRSLSSSPWIRNGTVGEDESGLVVTDLFDRDMGDFSDAERLERMIAVLGAERASLLAGRDKVEQALSGASFDDERGEDRFIDSIVSADGRTAAIQVQVIRQRPNDEAMDAAFPPGSGDRKVARALHTIDAQGLAVRDIKRILAEFPEREMHLTGIPVIEQHFPEVGKKDMSWLGLMFLIIGGALFLIYRKTSGVLLPLAVVFGSILAMNGTVWMFGDLINNLTASAPIIMTAVGIADAVHLVTAYFLLREQHSDKHELVQAVIKKNALPVFLTSLTTVVAFLSLMVSPIIPVKELGYTAAIGTTAAYLLSMTFVPAILSLFSLPKGTKGTAGNGERENKSYWTDALADFIRRRQSAILWSSVGILALAAIGLRQLRVESDVRLMFPASDPVVADQNWIEEKLGGSGDLDLVFHGAPQNADQKELERARIRAEELEIRLLRGEPLTEAEKVSLKKARATLDAAQRGRIATNERFLESVDRFERRLEDESQKPSSPLRALTSFDSGLSVLRRMHQVQNESRVAFYRVPRPEDVAPEAHKASLLEDPFTGESSLIPAQTASTLSAQYYLQYENGAKPAENLSPFVSPDRRGFRIAARVKSQSSAEMLAAYSEIRRIARTDFPELVGTESSVESGEALATMRMTGKHYLFMNMMERFTATLMNSLGLALLIITLVIGVVFRSPRVALVSMVPNVMPLVVPLSLFGLLGISLDGPAVIVATIALGICVDDTIHLLTKFQAAKKTGVSTAESIRVAFRQVGAALTWTSITLVVGFAVLSLSQFRPNMLIGAVGAAMVALAWLADLIVTPALLALVFPDTQRVPEHALQKSPQPAE